MGACLLYLCMILSLKSMQPGGDCQYFFCNIDDLESGFEVLSMLAAQGDLVLEAHIMDETTRLDLPAHIFDGKPFRSPIRRLEKQWTRILNKPVGKGSVHNLELKATTHRLMGTHQRQLDHALLCIDRLVELQKRARQTISDAVWQTVMLNRYQELINGHRVRIEQLQGFQHRSQDLITRLER